MLLIENVGEEIRVLGDLIKLTSKAMEYIKGKGTRIYRYISVGEAEMNIGILDHPLFQCVYSLLIAFLAFSFDAKSICPLLSSSLEEKILSTFLRICLLSIFVLVLNLYRGFQWFSDLLHDSQREIWTTNGLKEVSFFNVLFFLVFSFFQR